MISQIAEVKYFFKISKFKKMKNAVLLSALLLGTTITGFAQEAKKLSDHEQAIIMGRQLADYGYAKKDVMSLATAAKIISSNTKGEMLVSEKTETDSKGANTSVVSTASSSSKSSKTSIDPAQLIRDAKVLANGNTALLGAVAEIEKGMTSSKGLVGGSVTKHYRIASNSTKTLTGRFRGGERARLTVNGDGDTDLDLYVYDESDNLVESDSDGTDYCIATWTPKWTGEFKIVIKNRGSVYNDCVLISN
jgi:hypothetical protein